MYENPDGNIFRAVSIDIVAVDSGEKICAAKAGPKTHISAVKSEISSASGIPLREIELFADLHNVRHKFKDAETVGSDVFKHEAPTLLLKRLSSEEADSAEARQKAYERILHGTHLKDLEADLRADQDIVLFAVEHNHADLQFAADEVKSNRNTMIEAMKITTATMYYAAPALWEDHEFVKGIVQIDGLMLGNKLVTQKWRSDPDIVIHACENHGYALQYASEELKNNRPVVIAAVNQRGVALAYASEEMKNDYYIVLDAVRNNRMAIVHAKGGLREDDDIRKAAGHGPSKNKAEQERIDRLMNKFHELDVDHDGYLSYEELESLLKKGNPNMSDDEIRLLYDQLDVHHDGKVDFHEFCDFIHSA